MTTTTTTSRTTLAAISAIMLIGAMVTLNTLVMVGFSVELSFAIVTCSHQLISFLRDEAIYEGRGVSRKTTLCQRVIVQLVVMVVITLWSLFMPSWAFKGLVLVILFGMIGEAATFLITSKSVSISVTTFTED